MFSTLFFLCITSLVCFVLWHQVTYIFISLILRQTNQNHSDKKTKIPFPALHFCLIIAWTFLSLLLLFSLQPQYANKQDLLLESLLDNTMNIMLLCLILVCMLLLHILSTLDSLFTCVPNILLVLLFCICNILYFFTQNTYDFYPFFILGITYAIFFCLHLFGKQEKIGEGDLWIIASIAIFLESFFTGYIECIFEVLALASFSAIFLHIILLQKNKISMQNKKLFLQSQNTQILSKQIPFIPFLMFGFLLVSAFHVA